MSDIKNVYAMINGQKVMAVYDESTKTYSVETSAPSESSWNQPDHVYNVTLHAEDAAGNTVEMDGSDTTYGSQLKIRVLETTKPVATIVSPTESSVLGNSTQEISLKLLDSGGSGLNMSTVDFKINNEAITELTWTDDESGAKISTYTATNLPDGNNTITLSVSDNDGNVAEVATTHFVISTSAPTLSVDTPVDNLITNSSKVTVSGSTAPGSDFVTIASVTINNEAVIVSENGTFSKEVTLTNGSNVLTIVSTDSIGKTTSVTRTVVYDSAAPVITDVVAEATTVNVDGRIRITFKITD